MKRLEQELSKQLAPVTAPDCLWAQIHQQRRPLRVCPQYKAVWAVAAMGILLVSARFAVTEQLHAGTHLIRVKGTPVEAVTYREGGVYSATLVTPGKHRAWNTVALKLPDDLRRACVLCHTDSFN